MSGRESFLPLESQAYALGRPEHRARIKQHHDDFVVVETFVVAWNRVRHTADL